MKRPLPVLALFLALCAAMIASAPARAQGGIGYIWGWDTSLGQKCLIGSSSTCTTAPNASGGTGGGAVVPSTINTPKVQSIAATATQLTDAQTYAVGFVISALPSNVAQVCLGKTSGVTLTTGYCLAPGQAVSYALTNAAALYAIASSAGDSLQWTGN